MPVPTTNTAWALDDVSETDPVTSNSVDNKSPPPEILRLTGALYNTRPLTRPHLNYMFNSHHQWIQWLRSREIGEKKMVDVSVIGTEMTARFGGTWNDEGTTTVTTTSGVQTFRIFTRTA